MEKVLLWSLFCLGIVLFFYSFRKKPRKDWLLIFMLTGYVASILGVIAVERRMVTYPVRLFPQYFSTSVLYEHLLLPVVSIYFYQTTFEAAPKKIFGVAFLYTAVLTSIEVFLENTTRVIEYHEWNWFYSFISIFGLLLFSRMVVSFLNRK